MHDRHNDLLSAGISAIKRTIFEESEELMAAELHKPHQPYKPKAREEYMNSKQLAHFRNMP